MTSSQIAFEMDVYNVTTYNVTAWPFDNVTSHQETSSPSLIYRLPGPIICLFGILCNILNMCVLSQKMLKETPYTYLKALAFSDLLLLFISIIHLLTIKTPNTFVKAFYTSYIFYPVANIFFNISVWLIVALTIERMLFVVRPMKTRPSKRITRIVIGSVFFWCALINFPRFYCYRVRSLGDEYVPNGTPFRESARFYHVSWFQAVVINFIPNAILIVTNTVLMIALHRADQKRKELRTNREARIHRDQTRLTRTLIVIVIVFFICTIPSAFVEDPINYALFGKGQTWTEYLESPSNKLFTHISNLLLFLNSSLNFVLYCVFNKKFRTATKKLFLSIRTRTEVLFYGESAPRGRYTVCKDTSTRF